MPGIAMVGGLRVRARGGDTDRNSFRERLLLPTVRERERVLDEPPFALRPSLEPESEITSVKNWFADDSTERLPLWRSRAVSTIFRTLRSAKSAPLLLPQITILYKIPQQCSWIRASSGYVDMKSSTFAISSFSILEPSPLMPSTSTANNAQHFSTTLASVWYLDAIFIVVSIAPLAIARDFAASSPDTTTSSVANPARTIAGSFMYDLSTSSRVSGSAAVNACSFPSTSSDSALNRTNEFCRIFGSTFGTRNTRAAFSTAPSFTIFSTIDDS
mmetsp:Transcript_11203/g.24072  ORF Transcript_11203/g.24072 Transcript_11203/m.24072 type:complete len:273 (-) Transcript_11203:1468-2286(-)